MIGQWHPGGCRCVVCTGSNVLPQPLHMEQNPEVGHLRYLVNQMLIRLEQLEKKVNKYED